MTHFSAKATLERLKDFQLRTVDYVFRRMYEDAQPAIRFLVADEVGLGKTMVAKGVIARMLEHFGEKEERIDIIYVCSNAAIANQNVGRLNVLGTEGFSLATRLTLLPLTVKALKKNRINFVSFTPGTTFDLKSRAGLKSERLLIFRMLMNTSLNREGLLHVLQGTAGIVGWRQDAERYAEDFDADLARSFRLAFAADKEFFDEADDLCLRFRHYRAMPPAAENESRYALIGRLRQLLAHVCLKGLEPKLVILDEFQRFRHLLDKDDAASSLARELFDCSGARILLLSATPYKMLSLDHEQEDDHYPDFLKTLKFLFNDRDGLVKDVERDIQSFRLALMEMEPSGNLTAQSSRGNLADRLRSVMCRTERVARTARHDAMLTEPPCPVELQVGDLKQARLLDAVSRMVKARDSIEYWKSAPYALNFMKAYELRHNMDRLQGEEKAELARLVSKNSASLLPVEKVTNYGVIDAANPRLRSLIRDSLDTGLWKLLWLPPSLPYWQPAGSFAEVGNPTKTLVFSAWNVVPDAIAVLCSYEAERRAVATQDKELSYETLYDQIKPLLTFREADGRLTGMPALLLQYPSPTLASLVDPVDEYLYGNSRPSLERILRRVETRLRKLVRPLLRGATKQGREDERWYWVVPALLDKATFTELVQWVNGAWQNEESGDMGTDDAGTALGEHVKHFGGAMRDVSKLRLGKPPEDLFSVLAELALGGPAINALRSLHRLTPELSWDDASMLSAAAKVGEGFRSLFNIPESIILLRGQDADESYWRLALRHCLEGNLPALLDEQAHILSESLGLTDKNGMERVSGIAVEIRQSLSIRTSVLSVDNLKPRPKLGTIDSKALRFRCRIALRFGELKDEKSEARVETLRSAFNSPFRPFILASTSVGQEGLDFHHWSHAILHWNLPSNPVDLEQREGRVHRYKGHAVRKNVAKDMGFLALRQGWVTGGDPWAVMFSATRQKTGDDLLAYWLYETDGGASIERRVPLLPFSRDVAYLARLKRGLALYRLVFGQPRQEDLIAHLSTVLPPEDVDRVVAEWRIDISPPAQGSDESEIQSGLDR